jgi:hypothetical protein
VRVSQIREIWSDPAASPVESVLAYNKANLSLQIINDRYYDHYIATARSKPDENPVTTSLRTAGGSVQAAQRRTGLPSMPLTRPSAPPVSTAS